MHLHYVATLPILFCGATGSYSGSGSSSDNAGHDAGVVYLPVESLQNELLNTTGLVPDSLVAVTASYEALKDEAPGLARVTAPNTTVYASVLIVPAKSSNAASDTHEAAPADALSGRTQLTYNCTSAAKLWNLQEDPSVVKLESFQQVSSSVSTDNSTSSNTTDKPREIVAITSIEVSNCGTVEKAAVGRPVLGNAFFSAEFSSDPAYFYTMSASGTNISASGSCLLRLEMAQANFTEVYPSCKISLQSTDFDNIVHSDAVTASGAKANDTRRLELGSYGFVKDPTCSYECGVGYAGPDECLVYLGDYQFATAKCRLQFYQQNTYCDDNECGDKVGDLDVPPDQCFQCYTDLWGDCDDGYTKASSGSRTCCKALTCAPVEDTTVETPQGLSWNLESDGSITNPSFVIYQGGDCSDPYDLSSTCCRITCENCYVSLSIASFYVDLDAHGVADYSTTAEMKLTGNSYLQVKIFAPSGCVFEHTNNVIDLTASRPLFAGVSVEVNMQLDLLKNIVLKPHGASAQFGASTDIQGITTGYINSEQFFDIQVTSTPSKSLGQNGIDIDFEVAAIPSVTASISLLDGIAKVGVRTSYTSFVKLKTGVEFPEPYPALSSPYLDPTSEVQFGDCSVPHFMEYAGYSGYRDVTVSLPMEFGIDSIYSKTYEPKWDLGLSMNKTLFSGCIATAYDAEMLLSTALTAVSSLSNEKQQKLKKVVMWALGLSEIDPDFLTINSISADTGEISIRIAVPPSVADNYPTASHLQNAMYQRARTMSFSNAISAYVGLEMSAQCDSGWWGTTCENSCDLGHCDSGTCNAVNGAITFCNGCDRGYWGSSCEERCDVPTHCVSAWCPQYSEAASGCSSCDEGWEGDLCETASRSGSSRSSNASGSSRSSDSSGSTDSTTPTTNGNTQTSSASTRAAQGPLVWIQVLISAAGLTWML